MPVYKDCNNHEINDIIVPSNRDSIEINLKIYYYKHNKLIIGLCILLQISFLINLLFFFQEDI